MSILTTPNQLILFFVETVLIFTIIWNWRKVFRELEVNFVLILNYFFIFDNA